MKPKLSDVNKNKVSNFYAELRRESDLVGGIPIAVRHLESIIRISECKLCNKFCFSVCKDELKRPCQI
jgi:DNA replicative helicase MCM subunit Mcm2 (Cdc46/Mcm family)